EPSLHAAPHRYCCCSVIASEFIASYVQGRTFGGTMAFRFRYEMVLVVVGVTAMVQDCAGVQPAGAQTTSSSNTGTVYVSRPSQFAGAGLSVTVSVNGKSVGSIGNGECMKLTLAAGRHTISGNNMWGGIFTGGGAVPVRIEVRPGASTHV